MKLTKWLFIVAILVAGAWAFATYNKVPPAPAANIQSAKWMMSELYEPGSREIEWKDRSRPTPAHHEYDGDDKRYFNGALWYPAVEQDQIAPGQHPLVIYSHGFSSMYSSGEYLAENLASRGYIVLSVNYPLTYMDAPGGPWINDVVNQPADISYFIDTVLAMNADVDSFLYQRIAAEHIGVMGISLGGLTSTLAVYHPRWADERITAAISIAGPTAMFSETFFEKPNVPFLMIAADTDALVTYETNALPVLDKVPDSWLMTVTSGSHVGFSGTAEYFRWLNNPDSLACEVVLRNLAKSEEDTTYTLLGTEEEGILPIVEMPPCPDDLPKAMNVLRQYQLTQMAVASFFEMQFGQTQAERDWAQEFFSVGLGSENAEVSLIAASATKDN